MLVPTGSDLNYNQENIDTPKGVQKEIACMSWSTTEGEVTPLLFKLKDEDGIIQTFDKIHVNYSEKKLYCGIPSFEYNCNVIINGIKVTLILQRYPETGKWYLLEKA